MDIYPGERSGVEVILGSNDGIPLGKPSLKANECDAS
jgi:hypothetical protein